MGLFGLWSSEDDRRKEEVRTGARAPDRNERKRCWEARASFFRCLDKHDVIDSLGAEGKKTADAHCADEDRRFHEDCATAWVSALYSSGRFCLLIVFFVVVMIGYVF